MAVKIVREPKAEERVCGHCKCAVSYQPINVKYTTTHIQVDSTGVWGHIVCPKCRNKIQVSYSSWAWRSNDYRPCREADRVFFVAL